MVADGSRRDALRAELDAALGTSGNPNQNLYECTVAGTSGSDVIVELGPRVQGMIPLAEFEDKPEVGSSLRASLRGREDGLWIFSIKEARALAAWDEMEIGSLVKGTVVGLNKGGLELRVGSLRAFLPASQVALHHVEDLSSYGEQTLVCEVLEIDRDKKRIVVSRRSVLEAEREEHREQGMGRIEVGGIVRGKVSRLETFGAFVDLGHGIEGLLHVSNMAHRRVELPEELVKSGDDLELIVLKIEEGGRRIGLGLKQLQEDPWDSVQGRFGSDAVVTGTVRRLTDFGAFVELTPGVDGLLHISQMDAGRVHNVKDVVKVGDTFPVRVLTVDGSARRISLSRLDPRGALLGSEEAAASDEVERVLADTTPAKLGTNLGDLFKKALQEKGGS